MLTSLFLLGFFFFLIFGTRFADYSVFRFFSFDVLAGTKFSLNSFDKFFEFPGSWAELSELRS